MPPEKSCARVKVCRIPEGGGHEQGVDDYIVADGGGVDPKKVIRDLLDSAEEPAPPTAIEMKMPARDIDAGPEADAFLDRARTDGVSRLRFWRGAWFHWTRSAYAEIQPAEARGELVKHLDMRFANLTASATGNVLDVLRAKAMLRGRIEPPAWIGDKSEPWPADEVLAAKNGIVHIPSLVAGVNYTMPPTPRFFTTNAIDYDFRADAPAPENWLAFLSQLWPDDPGSINTLQEWVGYTTTPDTRQQKIPLGCRPEAIREGHHRPRTAQLDRSGELLRADAGKPIAKLWIVAVAGEIGCHFRRPAAGADSQVVVGAS